MGHAVVACLTCRRNIGGDLIFIDNEFGHSVLQHGERIYFEVCDLRFKESSSNMK